MGLGLLVVVLPLAVGLLLVLVQRLVVVAAGSVQLAEVAAVAVVAVPLLMVVERVLCIRIVLLLLLNGDMQVLGVLQGFLILFLVRLVLVEIVRIKLLLGVVPQVW